MRITFEAIITKNNFNPHAFALSTLDTVLLLLLCGRGRGSLLVINYFTHLKRQQRKDFKLLFCAIATIIISLFRYV